MLRIFSDPRCLEHRAPVGYPERPDRLTGILAQLQASDFDFAPEVATAEPRAAAVAAVQALHDPSYLERFEAAVKRGDGLIDSADNPLSPGTWQAAWGAVAAAVAAVDWAMAEERRAAFVAVRPPGHHAERTTAMGFCYLNTVAAAAQHSLRHHGLERVAIVDFDVHHGNGTQHLFEDRSDVLFISLHQFPFYPGTGAAAETGIGDGQGATLNVPLPVGTGDDVYLQVFDEQVVPSLERFAPQLLLISAGFDAWQGDPLGGMRMTLDGYRRFGERLAAAAGEICSGRSVSLLEGGYDLERLADLVESYLKGLIDGSPPRG